MGTKRTLAAAGVLAVEATIGACILAVHWALTAEYGDITRLANGGAAGVSRVALAVVGAAALGALFAAKDHRVAIAAVVVPMLVMVGWPSVTRAALQEKLAVQYDAGPQCVFEEDMGPGPGKRAERASQRAFDSIEHVGYFAGGGASGIVGCDRALLLIEDVDVLEHYRTALPEAGWQVVADRPGRVRAERDAMAFEVVRCDRGGVVWAGSKRLRGGAGCSQDGTGLVGLGGAG
jgi:hypothetical protein